MTHWYLIGLLTIHGYYGLEDIVVLNNQFQFETEAQCLKAITRIKEGEILGLKIRTDEGYKTAYNKSHWKLNEEKCVSRLE